MFPKQTINDVSVEGKRVLVRVDFNVPLSDGAVTDDTRIRKALPTIRTLIDRGAKVILVSHLGRPAGEGFEAAFSLRPAARSLKRLIGRDVTFVEDLTGEKAHEAVDNMNDGDIVMLENIRFDKREKKNDCEFAKELASLADIFVNDAFGTSHRAHASVVGVAELLPAVAGMLLTTEVETLNMLLKNPDRPFVAVLGGSKVSDKIGVIDALLDVVDTLLIGGGMCFTFMKAQGFNIGNSLVEDEWVEAAGKMLKKAEAKGVYFVLPSDYIVSDEFAEDANIRVVGAREIPDGMMGLDIGYASSEIYKQILGRAKTVFWNGPMGVFEMKAFEQGTHAVAAAISANARCTSIIGGGDSVAAVTKFGLDDRVSFISTGGGASMMMLEGKKLPGVEALNDIR